MALEQIIKTSLFTQEELAVIQQVLDKGQIEHLMKIFPDIDLSPDKEIEIAKLKSFYSRSTPGYSDEEVKKKWKKVDISTPEQELEVQKELNAHKQAWMMAHGFKADQPFASSKIEKESEPPEEPLGEKIVGSIEEPPKKRGRPKKVVEE